MDYMNYRNIMADTEMRTSISRATKEETDDNNDKNNCSVR